MAAAPRGLAARDGLITISWKRTERLNKNITCLVSADPAGSVSSGSHGRLVRRSGAGFAVQKWSGMTRRRRFPLGRRGEHCVAAPYRAHLSWAGPAGVASAVAGRRLVGGAARRRSAVKRDENNYRRPSVVRRVLRDAESQALRSRDFINTARRLVASI